MGLSAGGIIFVCHSMGGIVTRYLLEANHHEFGEKNVGLVLIASPSYGAKLANNLNNIIAFFTFAVELFITTSNAMSCCRRVHSP